MSLQNRAFFILDASDTDGPLWLRCRKLTVQEAFEMEDLIRLARSAHTPTRPTDDDGDDDGEPVVEMDAEERQEKTMKILSESNRIAVHLVRGYSEAESAPLKASEWTPCRLVLDEADSGGLVDGAEQVWIESIAPSIREEILVRSMTEFFEAKKKVARFRAQSAAAAASPSA